MTWYLIALAPHVNSLVFTFLDYSNRDGRRGCVTKKKDDVVTNRAVLTYPKKNRTVQTLEKNKAVQTRFEIRFL